MYKTRIEKHMRVFVPPCVFFLKILLVLCVLCGLVPAQKRNALGWIWQNPLPQGNPLYSIHFTKDKQTGFAVGADGTIYTATFSLDPGYVTESGSGANTVTVKP